MATEYTIPEIIDFAKRSQVNVTMAIQRNLYFKNGTLNADYADIMHAARLDVEFMQAANPNYPTLRQVAEWLYALVRPFVVIAPPATISISAPANVSVQVGQNASFSVSVSVSNAAPYTLQWFRNGIPIPGATGTTYTLVNAQLSDSGAVFNAVATAPGVGVAVSTTATVTVTAVPAQGSFAYMDTDPFPTLQAGLDPFTYQISFPLAANYTIPLPTASSPNKYMIVRVPVSEPIKGTWFNDFFNQGTLGILGDFNWRGYVQFGGFTYYSSRQALSLNTLNTLIFSP